MIFARQGSHAQASQLIYRRRGPLWIGRGVSDHQLEWTPEDPAGVVDLANGELEPGEQMPASLDPAGPGERDERTDLNVPCHAARSSRATSVSAARVVSASGCRPPGGSRA